MARRRFTEKEVLETLIHQGVEIRDFRSGEPITLENVAEIEREHLHEIALGGPDDPANCRYSLSKNHHIVTNGTPATTAGSSKNRIAKATQPARIEKFQVKKIPLDADLVSEPAGRCRRCGECPEACACQSAPRRAAFGGRRASP